uniref:Putative secreted protein n=1 Tax=Amblyomma triste TaxID=251400 RepID=A0A023G0R7_AMBTT
MLTSSIFFLKHFVCAVINIGCSLEHEHAALLRSWPNICEGPFMITVQTSSVHAYTDLSLKLRGISQSEWSCERESALNTVNLSTATWLQNKAITVHTSFIVNKNLSRRLNPNLLPVLGRHSVC